MRIALVHPTFWPEVRRGSERLIHDLGSELARRGHEVTLLTSHRGWPSRRAEDGIEVARAWRPPPVPGLRMHEFHTANIPAVVWRLATGSYDVAHAFFPSDAWGAVKATRFGGPPVIFSMHGIPAREYLVAKRYRLEMLLTTVAGAAEVSVLSEAARGPFRRYLLRDPRVLPGGVVVADYSRHVERDPRPTVLCTASLGDPRKRGGLLAEAFERLRDRVPGARLVLAGGVDPVMSGAAVRVPERAEVLEISSDEDLIRAYDSAWVTVLPSVYEAFGLVLLESLAAGKPVVAARSGACAEIVTDPQHGILFEPDDPADLARALAEALALADDPATREACRAKAAEYDWSAVADLYEETYRSVLARRG